VFLIAKVGPAGVAGTVQFNDGTTALGSPVPVFNGFALFLIQKLTDGDHSLTALFTPTDPAAFTPSTSNTVPYRVNADAKAKDTRTELTVIPSGPLPQGVPRFLLANVAPAGAAGTVQFMDGTTTLGAPVPLSRAGVAFLVTSTLTPGAHSLAAAFTPTDSAAFGPSTSATIPVTVAEGLAPVAAEPKPGAGAPPTAAGSVLRPWQQLLQALFAGLGF
jgi:hypothetical protein